MTLLERIKVAWQLFSAYDAAVDAAKKEDPKMKSILASKTFWFNIVAALVQVASSAGLIATIPQPYGALAQAAVNVILRIVTTEPVAVLPPS